MGILATQVNSIWEIIGKQVHRLDIISCHVPWGGEYDDG